MTNFLTEDFLLQSGTAKRLYHDFAKDLPIIDYHNHLPPAAIAQNKNFKNITDLWLGGDHYKWRALRTLGVEEKYITGNASDEEKFLKWAEAVPYTIRNPLYHWTHMELKDPFGIRELLSEKTGKNIYDSCNELLKEPGFTPQALLTHFKVEMVGTTDDPADTLVHHKQIATSRFEVKVWPSFRPDRVLNISGGDQYRRYVQSLAEVAKIEITDLSSLLDALKNRVEYFNEAGCRISDHGLSSIPYPSFNYSQIEAGFKKVLAGGDAGAAGIKESFSAFVLLELCKMYRQKGWVQQFHLGAQRSNNSRMQNLIGADTGFDSISDEVQAASMAAFFNHLDKEDTLPKTIIYNLNPAYNAVFASMTGNFQGEGIKGKIQFGSAWWFLDQLDGMKEQINTLSNLGLISCFIGMLTDSRSFLSYSRHEYFRRLLCNIFAEDIEKGLIPADIDWIGKMIQDICYYNAKTYFNITRLT